MDSHMNYCAQCGKFHEESAAFCSGCGASLQSPEPAPPPPEPAPVQTPAYSQSQQPAYGPPPAQPAGPENPVVTVFREHASSKAFLFAALLVSAVLFFNFILMFIPGSSPMDRIMTDFFEGFSEGSGGEFGGFNFDDFLETTDGQDVASSFIGLIPSILICVGLWLVYLAGCSREPFVKTTGLSILRGVTIFFLVILCLVPPFLLLAVSVFAVASGETAEDYVVAVVVLIISAIVVVIPLLYCIFMSKTLRSIRISLVTGQPVAKVSMLVIVINYIMAGFAIIGLLTSLPALANPGLNAGAGLLFCLAAAGDIVYIFVLTFVLLKYRSAMSALKHQAYGAGPGINPGPPPPPQYNNPYAYGGQQGGTPPPAAPYIPPEPPPQQREFVFCDVCFKQSPKEDTACTHCGAPLK